MTNQPYNTKFYSEIVNLLQSARSKVVRTVNQTMVLTYFEVGRILVKKEQGGKERAEYGKELLKGLSKVLTKGFGKGFSMTNLKQMRQLYVIYGIGQTLSDESGKPSTVLSEPEFNETGHYRIIHQETRDAYLGLLS